MKAIKLTCLIFVLIITGCAPVRVIDTLAPNSPKGYVEFYYLKSKANPSNADLSVKERKGQYIFTVDSSSRRRIGNSDKISFRFARLPGYYYTSSSIKTYYFEVKEDMITPIEIIFTGNSKIDVLEPEESISIKPETDDSHTGRNLIFVLSSFVALFFIVPI